MVVTGARALLRFNRPKRMWIGQPHPDAGTPVGGTPNLA